MQVLRPGHACWLNEQADRVALIVDAADDIRVARNAPGLESREHAF